ncbi:MAG TPA: PAS domain S-box protein [Opitutaceae bacterium]|nr:PAS domain S-box protein [Opitutaceae bacterium]
MPTDPLLPLEIESMVHSVVDQESIIAITDRKGTIVYANDRFCEISGYRRPELIGQNHRLLKSGRHPPEFYRNLWATILGGRVWRGEICNRAKDGHLYWVETTISPLRTEGLITHFVALRTDITARKIAEAELEEKQKREEDERRMAALGRMADGVLHDLNNILTGVMGLAAETRTDERNAMLQESIGRMAQLTRTLRDYSTGRPARPEPFRLLPLLACATSLVRYRKGVPRNLSIVEKHEPLEGCELEGNEAQIFEVALNLAVNSAEAMAGVARPELRVTTKLDGDHVVVRFEDNGSGVPAEVAPTIFEPYSSTKGRGRGLGLSVARRIAEAHSGTLELEALGGAGHGACFRLELPARAISRRGEEILPGVGQRRVVLVSEDDGEVRRLIENAANMNGLSVMYPGDGADLVALASRMGAVLAAAVIDSCEIDSNKGTVACLRQVVPGLPILLISATLPARGKRITPWGEVDSFPKPFAVGELAEALQLAARAEPRV